MKAVSGSAVDWPFAARAQMDARRFGVLMAIPHDAAARAPEQKAADAGWIVRRNMRNFQAGT
jgi:ABC-type uncharacterized transport system YnjBCD permease subunit